MKFNILQLLLSLSFLCFSQSIFSQIQLVPLDENLEIIDYLEKYPEKRQQKNTQVCSTLTLTLPFFDDFANNPNGYYPDCAKWQDNHAFINQTMAQNPPSIGTATLDGLNAEGRPYDPLVDPNNAFAADTLSSQLIDLSGKTAANNIIFSFYYQQQGLSDRPEINDSLILEFLDTANNWQLMSRHAGVSNAVSQLDIPGFNQGFVIMDNAAFFHAAFQFRFRNKASICGNNDHWHLDHIYIDENRTDTTSPVYYSDVCFTAAPISAFKKYTAIPWQHFDASLWNDTLSMRNFNHSNQSGALDRTYTIEDTAGTAILSVATPSFNYNPSPNIRDSYDTVLTGAFASYNPLGPTLLRSTYTIDNPTAFQNNSLFTNSDTALRYTILDNYFAYDDGTPEMRCLLQGIGTQLAVEFKTTVADTLRGIYFHLPYYLNRNSEDDFINVKVWVNNLSAEVFSRDIYRLRYVVGFGGYHYVQLLDFAGDPTPVALPANTTFYVGWQQASSVPVPVGIDRNSDRDDRTFVKVGGNAWVNTDINCAVMIRPLLSPDNNPTIIGTEEPALPAKKLSMQVFPNPSSGLINLVCEGCDPNAPYQLRVYNQLGQLVQQTAFQNSLDLSVLAQGLYTLTLWNEAGQNLGQSRLLLR